MSWLTGLHDSPELRQAIASGVLALLLVLARVLIVRALRRSDMPPEARRRWMVIARNTAILLFILGLSVIWAAELRTVALSFVAIAAAIVLATKELIVCMSGTLVRTTSARIKLGDRIEIAGHRGDVIDLGFLTTTLLEVGPGHASHQRTGRAIALPNSVWVSAPAINESFTHVYVLHIVSAATAATVDWRAIESALLTAANAECAGFLAEARDHIARMGSERGLDAPGVDPRVAIRVTKPGELEFQLRFPAPMHLRGRVEQAILRRFLDAQGHAMVAPPKRGDD